MGVGEIFNDALQFLRDTHAIGFGSPDYDFITYGQLKGQLGYTTLDDPRSYLDNGMLIGEHLYERRFRFNRKVLGYTIPPNMHLNVISEVPQQDPIYIQPYTEDVFKSIVKKATDLRAAYLENCWDYRPHCISLVGLDFDYYFKFINKPSPYFREQCGYFFPAYEAQNFYPLLRVIELAEALQHMQSHSCAIFNDALHMRNNVILKDQGETIVNMINQTHRVVDNWSLLDYEMRPLATLYEAHKVRELLFDPDDIVDNFKRRVNYYTANDFATMLANVALNVSEAILEDDDRAKFIAKALLFTDENIEDLIRASQRFRFGCITLEETQYYHDQNLYGVMGSERIQANIEISRHNTLSLYITEMFKNFLENKITRCRWLPNEWSDNVKWQDFYDAEPGDEYYLEDD